MRMSIAVLVVLGGCAAPTGRLSMRVDSPTAISRIEFANAATGDAVHMAAIPAGRSEQTAKVGPGRWCLVEHVVVLGNVSKHYKARAPICFEVEEGGSVDAGLFTLDDGRLRRVGGPPQPEGSQHTGLPEGQTSHLEQAKLSTKTIKLGMAAVKPDVLACMDQFAIAPGETLLVKVMIDGAEGKVVDAKVEPPFVDSPVVPCVEAAVRGATFPSFAAPRLGVVYPFKQ